MAVIKYHPMTEKPAPRFGEESVSGALSSIKMLLDQKAEIPDLCIIGLRETGKLISSPRLRVISILEHHDGSFSVRARMRGQCKEEHFYFAPEDIMPMQGIKITGLVVGYPQYRTSTVIVNTHLGTKTTFVGGVQVGQENISKAS